MDSTWKITKRVEHLHLLVDLVRWLLIASVAGVFAGTASAFLLASLNWATEVRESHRWLILLLPFAGLFVGCLYRYLGSSVEAGNNLILGEVHDPQATLPLRMTPLILLGTVVTHLFGGSAGREGTAIQTGASLADQLTRIFGLHAKDRRILLMAGISGGFGSVFGTPLAGAIFGIEVLAIGRVGYDAIFPCFVGAFAGDYITHAWGVHHTLYTVTESAQLTNQRLVMENSDIPPARLPQCLELVAEEDFLQAFLKQNENHLERVRVMFLRGEEARVKAAVEREELENVLDMERADHLLD